MAAVPGIAPPRPIPIKDRASILFVEKGRLDVLDGAFVVVDRTGVRTHIPVGGIACLMLEPGARVSHAAVALAARVGCLLVWVGEAGVRLYSAGQPGGARADRLLLRVPRPREDGPRGGRAGGLRQGERRSRVRGGYRSSASPGACYFSPGAASHNVRMGAA